MHRPPGATAARRTPDDTRRLTNSRCRSSSTDPNSNERQAAGGALALPVADAGDCCLGVVSGQPAQHVDGGSVRSRCGGVRLRVRVTERSTRLAGRAIARRRGLLLLGGRRGVRAVDRARRARRAGGRAGEQRPFRPRAAHVRGLCRRRGVCGRRAKREWALTLCAARVRVEAVLAEAEQEGGRIVRLAARAEWGGHRRVSPTRTGTCGWWRTTRVGPSSRTAAAGPPPAGHDQSSRADGWAWSASSSS
jgi:hypothetical protein